MRFLDIQVNNVENVGTVMGQSEAISGQGLKNCIQIGSLCVCITIYALQRLMCGLENLFIGDQVPSAHSIVTFKYSQTLKQLLVIRGLYDQPTMTTFEVTHELAFCNLFSNLIYPNADQTKLEISQTTSKRKTPRSWTQSFILNFKWKDHTVQKEKEICLKSELGFKSRIWD